MTCQQTPKWHVQKEFTSGSELPNGGGGKTSKPIKSQIILNLWLLKGLLALAALLEHFGYIYQLAL